MCDRNQGCQLGQIVSRAGLFGSGSGLKLTKFSDLQYFGPETYFLS